MNFILLDEAAAQSPMGGGSMTWIMLIAIFVVMYFFMIRPQQKRQKELRKFRDNLKKGDKVVTVGGIYGTVSEIKDSYVIIEVDGNVRIRFDKASVLKDSSDLIQTK
ncbi:MAG: preprotein translocase subunit YajC [Prevotellaceae bacterium]|jgi:preprotein translocase subunit YajC|nr:preprotein translocase subunit YajC [Prevotellaceae bacterium]